MGRGQIALHLRRRGWDSENILSRARLNLVGEVRLDAGRKRYAVDYVQPHPVAKEFIHFQDFDSLLTLCGKG